VDKAEFLKSLESIERWAGKIENPSEEFDRMDADKQGTITFDEFCDWSIKRNLDLDDDGENCLAITQTPVESGVATPATEAAEK
jgi:Ca2+-binding EF-hand superfamily protein